VYSISSEIYLRVVSGGTSYCQSRLVFCPYTQLIRTICTSAPVRSSTPLSWGFNLATHRSAGFGSRGNDYRRAHLVPCCLRTLAFATATGLKPLTSPLPGTPWVIIQNERQDIAPLSKIASSLSCLISL